MEKHIIICRNHAGGNGLKRKGTTTVLERAVKAVRAKGRPRLHEESPPSISAVVNTGKRSIKQQDSMRRPVKVPKLDGVGGFDPPIVDEGPKADWVKINVHKHVSKYGHLSCLYFTVLCWNYINR